MRIRRFARPVRCLVIIAIAAMAAPSIQARPKAPAASEVTVAIESVPEGALAGAVTIEPDGSDAWTVRVTLRNLTQAEARIGRVSIRLPWLREVPADLQLSLGASTMFDHPALVRMPTEDGLESANYLQSRSANGRSELIALLTWNTLRSKLRFDAGKVEVTADGEQRRLPGGGSLSLDTLWLAADDHWQEVLYRYADRLAVEHRIQPSRRPEWVGWSNWDYYGGRFTPEQVLENMRALVDLDVGANLLQIDGGWWTKCGDYLPRPDFPGGMAGMAEEFRRNGLTAGLHFDGARADADAEVVREHPEYFLKDQDGNLIGGRRRPDGRAGRVYFDFSHPGARQHYRDVFRRAREWGYRYFKVDFLKFALPEWVLHAEKRKDDGTRIVRHDDRITSVEALQLALRAMRDGMGEDAYFLGCTADFGTVIGHVDALRSGGDIDPTYSRFSRSCMENGGVFHLHRSVFLNDADYHVARGALDEDSSLVDNPRKTGGAMPFALAEMWTHYVGLFGGSKISGDNLLILRDERKDLFRRAVALPACERWFPVDFWQHGVNRDDPFRVFLGEAAGRVYLAVFNWNAEPTSFRIGGLPAGFSPRMRIMHGKGVIDADSEVAVVMLEGQHSVVLELPDDADFTGLSRSLRVDERVVSGSSPSP